MPFAGRSWRASSTASTHWLCPSCSRHTSLQRCSTAVTGVRSYSSQIAPSGSDVMDGAMQRMPSRLSRRAARLTHARIGSSTEKQEERLPSPLVSLLQAQTSLQAQTNLRAPQTPRSNAQRGEETSLTSWIHALEELDPSQNIILSMRRPNGSFSSEEVLQSRIAWEVERKRCMDRIQRCWRSRRLMHRTPPTLLEYEMMLAYAARLGAKSWAERIWTEMSSDLVKPSPACYKSLMTAVLYNERDRLPQGKKSLQLPFGAETDAPRWTKIALWRSGALTRITELVQDMKAQNIPFDVTLYGFFMTALARDGKLDYVVDLLQRIWKLDVMALMEGSAVTHVSSYEPGSALYPTTAFLDTLADIFGAYGQAGRSLRIIDFISQHYDVPLKRSTWERLIFWTSMFARFEATARRRMAAQSMAHQLFVTATSPPHNITPSMSMLHRVFQNQRGLARLGEQSFTAPIEAMRALYLSGIRTQEIARAKLASFDRVGYNSLLGANGLHRARLHTRQRWLRRRVALLNMNRMLRASARHGVPESWERSEEQAQKLEAWRVRGIPKLVSRYEALLPSRLKYQTASASVELLLRPSRRLEQARRRRGLDILSLPSAPLASGAELRQRSQGQKALARALEKLRFESPVDS